MQTPERNLVAHSALDLQVKEQSVLNRRDLIDYLPLVFRPPNWRKIDFKDELRYFQIRCNNAFYLSRSRAHVF